VHPVRKDSLFFALFFLLLLVSCWTPGPDDDDDSSRDDDDSAASDDDDSSAQDLVLQPGVVHIALAAATATGVELELDGEIQGLGVRLHDCDPDTAWQELPFEQSQSPSFGISIQLPPMQAGTQLCGLELSFSEDLEILGDYEISGGGSQSFLLVLEIADIAFEFESITVDQDGAVALIAQVAQSDWVAPAQIGAPPEPKRGEIFVVDWAHTAYNSFVQQIQGFSGLYVDLNGDGALGENEFTSSGAAGSGGGLPRPEGLRFAAFGPSLCLDLAGVELVSCVDAEQYAPLVYGSVDLGGTWFMAPSPKMAVPSNIRAAAYGDGLYLAVGGVDSTGDGQDDKGIVMSSVDAESWGAWLVEKPLTGIAHAQDGSAWVAVGAGGETYRSRNGVFWEENAPTASACAFRDVAWSGAGFYVAVGDAGKWAWSVSGEEWTVVDGLSHNTVTTSLRGVASTSTDTVLAVGDFGAWLELENPSEFVAGTQAASWVEQAISGNPSLTDLVIYRDDAFGETAVAVSPTNNLSKLVTQQVGMTASLGPPQSFDLSQGVLAQAITVMDNRCFTIGGSTGLSSWVDNLLGVDAGVPHDHVNHSISAVVTGGE